MAEAEKKEAAEDAKDAAAEGAPAPAPRSRLARLLPYLIGGVLSAGLGITAGIVTERKKKQHDDAAAESAKAPVSPFDDFGEPEQIVLELGVLQLADPGQSVAGRFKIFLEVRLKKEGKVRIEELRASCTDQTKPLFGRIQDKFITLFRTKVSTDVRTGHGIEILKLEIIEVLNPILFSDPSEGVITDVLLGQFLIQ